MNLSCPHCVGTGTAPGRPEHCGYCLGRGQLHLSRRRRKEAVVGLIEHRACTVAPAQRLAFRVVGKAILDLGTANDSSAEILAGTLTPWLWVLGIAPDLLLAGLADAQLTPAGPPSRPAPRAGSTPAEIQG